MSTTVFNDSFTVAKPYSEDFSYPVDVVNAGDMRRIRKQRLPYGLFKVYQGVIEFPRNALSTWEDFWVAMAGGYDSFLYLPVLGIHRSVADEALGTAAGGGSEEFALDCKYIKASTLVIKSGGVTQTTPSPGTTPPRSSRRLRPSTPGRSRRPTTATSPASSSRTRGARTSAPSPRRTPPPSSASRA